MVKAFESYPASTVLVNNLASFATYLAGFYILLQIGALFGALFILYAIFMEFSVYREGCVSCYYYGKVCATGRGKIAPIFFKRDDPKKFCEKEVTWKNMLPQVLVVVVPVVVAVYLLIQSFSWPILGVMLVPILIWFFGNPTLYGKLNCPHCKQGRICCPAMEFFSKM
jgi:hypothetical protein